MAITLSRFPTGSKRQEGSNIANRNYLVLNTIFFPQNRIRIQQKSVFWKKMIPSLKATKLKIVDSAKSVDLEKVQHNWLHLDPKNLPSSLWICNNTYCKTLQEFCCLLFGLCKGKCQQKTFSIAIFNFALSLPQPKNFYNCQCLISMHRFPSLCYFDKEKSRQIAE